MKNIGCIILFLFLFNACNEYAESSLTGEWKGAALLEDGMPLEVDPAEIGFEFNKNGLYQFRSTLNYKEAGTFSIRGNLLYTLDTINEASTEKAVKIVLLTADSLFIKMNADGKERIVKLAKVK